MGILIVLILWAVVGSILAGICGLIVGGIAHLFTRGVAEGRKRAIFSAAMFPFVCLGWAAVIFIFQAMVNGTVLDRDMGLGDTWHCPLPNGFAITMIDVTDYGEVYNETRTSKSGFTKEEDSVNGVKFLQFSGKHIFGTADSKSFGKINPGPEVDTYFVFDTQTGNRTMFSNMEEMRAAASKLGVTLELQPIVNIYSKYRFGWFDVAAGFLWLIPLAVLAGFLVRRVIRLRKTRDLAFQPT